MCLPYPASFVIHKNRPEGPSPLPDKAPYLCISMTSSVVRILLTMSHLIPLISLSLALLVLWQNLGQQSLETGVRGLQAEPLRGKSPLVLQFSMGKNLTTVLGLCLDPRLWPMAACCGYPPASAQLQMVSSSLGLLKNAQHCVRALPIPLSRVTASTAKGKRSSPGEWALHHSHLCTLPPPHPPVRHWSENWEQARETHIPKTTKRSVGVQGLRPLVIEIWLTMTCFYTQLLCRQAQASLCEPTVDMLRGAAVPSLRPVHCTSHVLCDFDSAETTGHF